MKIKYVNKIYKALLLHFLFPKLHTFSKKYLRLKLRNYCNFEEKL